MPKVDDKWSKVEAELAPEVRPLLKILKADYLAAKKIHVPGFPGGPNAGILSELIRMGWRKPE